MAATVATRLVDARKLVATLPLGAEVEEEDAACDEELAASVAGDAAAEVAAELAGLEPVGALPPMGAVEAPLISACTLALNVPVMPDIL